MNEFAIEARQFAHACRHGVLSTLSQRVEGYPFGSVTPFMLDDDGCPILLISEIAEHTKNLKVDARCSLIMQPFAEDMQSTGRVTLIGQAAPLPDKDRLGPRYLQRFPQATDYFALHDFGFWRIQPTRIRWIGGFGRIHWITAEAWSNALSPSTGIAP